MQIVAREDLIDDLRLLPFFAQKPTHETNVLHWTQVFKQCDILFGVGHQILLLEARCLVHVHSEGFDNT